MLMIDDNKKAYQVLERCSDLFPEWKKGHGQFWNSKTGEIITEDGIKMHDLVYRGDGSELVEFMKEVIEHPIPEQLYLFPMENIN